MKSLSSLRWCVWWHSGWTTVWWIPHKVKNTWSNGMMCVARTPHFIWQVVHGGRDRNLSHILQHNKRRERWRPGVSPFKKKILRFRQCLSQIPIDLQLSRQSSTARFTSKIIFNFQLPLHFAEGIPLLASHYAMHALAGNFDPQKRMWTFSLVTQRKPKKPKQGPCGGFHKSRYL